MSQEKPKKAARQERPFLILFFPGLLDKPLKEQVIFLLDFIALFLIISGIILIIVQGPVVWPIILIFSLLLVTVWLIRSYLRFSITRVFQQLQEVSLISRETMNSNEALNETSQEIDDIFGSIKGQFTKAVSTLESLKAEGSAEAGELITETINRLHGIFRQLADWNQKISDRFRRSRKVQQVSGS